MKKLVAQSQKQGRFLIKPLVPRAPFSDKFLLKLAGNPYNGKNGIPL
jgi:hypothetical protein